MTKDMIKELADWIEELKQLAKDDAPIAISWFKGTMNEPFALIGGWQGDYAEELKGIVCLSKADPTYAMCVKIAINEGPYAYTDFEIMNMPTYGDGEVDDTCFALEYDDDPVQLAKFLANEWERITTTYGGM